MIHKSTTRRLKRISKYINPNDFVLDIGGGKCNIKNFINSKSYFCVDILDYENESYIKLDLNNAILPFPDKFCDIIIVSFILEHINSPYRNQTDFKTKRKINNNFPRHS